MEETTINDRIEQIIYHYKLNNSRLSKKIGLKSSTTINNIVSGRRSKPSYDVLRKIAEHFPVNPSWLLLGKGPMLLDAENDLKSNKIGGKEIVEIILETPEEFEKNPAFAKYLESKCYKAVVEHQDEMLLKFKKSGLD